jgi:hypothetical protein
VRFQLLEADGIKRALCRGVETCDLLEIHPIIRGASIVRSMNYRPDDGSSVFWKVVKFLPRYTAQHPRIQSSSATISLKTTNWLIFVVVMCCVFLEVRNEFLNIRPV